MNDYTIFYNTYILTLILSFMCAIMDLSEAPLQGSPGCSYALQRTALFIDGHPPPAQFSLLHLSQALAVKSSCTFHIIHLVRTSEVLRLGFFALGSHLDHKKPTGLHLPILRGNLFIYSQTQHYLPWIPRQSKSLRSITPVTQICWAGI